MRETVDEDRASVISYFVETAKVHVYVVYIILLETRDH